MSLEADDCFGRQDTHFVEWAMTITSYIAVILASSFYEFGLVICSLLILFFFFYRFKAREFAL